MPNPLDRQPSPTPEAGTFASLGVENVGGAKKLLSGTLETNSDSSNFDGVGLSFLDTRPNLKKTRELLESDAFEKYGIYSPDPERQSATNSLIDPESLSYLLGKAKETWHHIEEVSNVMDNEERQLVLGAAATQRALMSSYAFLPYFMSLNVADGLSKLRQVDPLAYIPEQLASGLQEAEGKICFIGSVKNDGIIESSLSALLAAKVGEDGCYEGKGCCVFSGENVSDGLFCSTDSVSFSDTNSLHGVSSSDYCTSFSRKNGSSYIFDSIRCLGATLTPPETQPDSTLVGAIRSFAGPTSNNLSLILGDKLPDPLLLYSNPDASKRDLNNLIVVEDRKDLITKPWAVAASDALQANNFSGALIVGGEVIYLA